MTTNPTTVAKAAGRALRGLDAVGPATERLIGAVGQLNDATVRQPSRLPGWSRAHLVTHLARNADAMVNLLTWARTGVEHAAYASQADRDADIVEGAVRPHQLLLEDLGAASERFADAAGSVPDSAWTATVTNNLKDVSFQAAEIPWLRLTEAWLHLVDLDVGVDVTAIPDELVEELVNEAVRGYRGRAEVPGFIVDAGLPDGRRRSWQVGAGAADEPGRRPAVRGDGVALLGWLTGRGDGDGLTGDLSVLPELPAWR